MAVVNSRQNISHNFRTKKHYKNFEIFLNRDSYPITSQGNIRIRPGHDTLVAINAVDIQADKAGIENIELEKRYVKHIAIYNVF